MPHSGKGGGGGGGNSEGRRPCNKIEPSPRGKQGCKILVDMRDAGWDAGDVLVVHGRPHIDGDHSLALRPHRRTVLNLTWEVSTRSAGTQHAVSAEHICNDCASAIMQMLKVPWLAAKGAWGAPGRVIMHGG